MDKSYVYMIASKSPRRALPKIPPKKIPAALIYEIIDGKPVYYKGYQEVLAQHKTIQEIMGSSNLQSTLFEYLLMIFFKTFNLSKYRILTNKIGIQISKSNNLSGDIAIYEKRDLPVSQADKHYIAIPPKIQIEVDVDAYIEAFETTDNYMYVKTNKLLEFGVAKVIWVMSSSKRVMIATPTDDLRIVDWHKDIEVLDGISFNIG